MNNDIRNTHPSAPTPTTPGWGGWLYSAASAVTTATTGALHSGVSFAQSTVVQATKVLVDTGVFDTAAKVTKTVCGAATMAKDVVGTTVAVAQAILPHVAQVAKAAVIVPYVAAQELITHRGTILLNVANTIVDVTGTAIESLEPYVSTLVGAQLSNALDPVKLLKTDNLSEFVTQQNPIGDGTITNKITQQIGVLTDKLLDVQDELIATGLESIANIMEIYNTIAQHPHWTEEQVTTALITWLHSNLNPEGQLIGGSFGVDPFIEQCAERIAENLRDCIDTTAAHSIHSLKDLVMRIFTWLMGLFTSWQTEGFLKKITAENFNLLFKENDPFKVIQEAMQAIIEDPIAKTALGYMMGGDLGGLSKFKDFCSKYFYLIAPSMLVALSNTAKNSLLHPTMQSANSVADKTKNIQNKLGTLLAQVRDLAGQGDPNQISDLSMRVTQQTLSPKALLQKTLESWKSWVHKNPSKL
jgi:hypothetical protein